MREIVSERFLIDAISQRMDKEPWSQAGVFGARPTRIKRDRNGPNWRHQFNTAEVPAG